MTEPWRRLGDPAPNTLTDARVQLHWAVQIVAAVGNTYLVPRPDDSHPNMEWLSKRDWLIGNVTETTPGFRACVHVPTLTLVFTTPAGETLAEHRLDGGTIDDAYAWLRSVIARESGGSLDRDLTRPTYDIPDHAVARGAAFRLGDAGCFAELARWFGNADLLLRGVAEVHPHAAPVRVWPHHFDIGTILALDPTARGEDAPVIGLGMTPGDGSYGEPYWYVNPWPRPDGTNLPEVAPEAHWHTEGWLGAVLTGAETAKPPTATEQRELTERYLVTAIEAGRAVAL